MIHSMKRQIGLKFLAIAVSAIFILVCATGSTGALAAEPAALQQVNNDMLVSTEWLAENLQTPGVIVLCIANQREFYTSGHIPGARLVMLSDLVETREGVPSELPSLEKVTRVFEAAGVKDADRIILYGEHSGLFAARAFWTLDYLGVGSQAALLDGGLEKWKAEGRPLSKKVERVKPGTLRTYANPDVLVSLEDLQDVLQKAPDSVALIDARPEAEFSGSKVSEGVAKAGHIPGARGLYWMKTLVSAANPVLRPEDELRSMFEQAGASEDRRVITYCRTGMQASFDYFVAKYLGYNTALYDGSFYEWSKKGMPAESDAKPSSPDEGKK
jgi:thiosulfate/3-mercaptopyruvate sulfurtransferase